MVYLRWTIYSILFLLLAAVLHYSLPDREIVQIVGTEVVRIDEPQPDGTVVSVDQPRINAERPDGRPSVFRNDDTGWAWPPYLKFDSANLQAQAQSAAKAEGTQWMVVRHYGWRIPVMSLFPNAISMRPADGPEESLIPWLNIILLSSLAIGLLVLRRIVLMLFGRHVQPWIDGVDQEIEETTEAISYRYRGIRGWFRQITGG
ncbi:MAG: DUF1523 family protein [Pseudomonadota bacterium]